MVLKHNNYGYDYGMGFSFMSYGIRLLPNSIFTLEININLI